MRCHYEVLCVERTATFDEIRSAYKKQALIYHPDKNHGNVEYAVAKFKEVQNAFAVLSDTNERQWYDAHRESILRGDSDGTCAPDELNLVPLFSRTCFQGFGDNPEGFFAVYRTAFQTLIDEEAIYDSRARSWPGFGSSDTPYKEVAAFYNHWRYFNSYKTFAWKDEYKLNEIPDRQSRRMAERINLKERAAAKKEYTGLVTGLAELLMGRDPRVQREKERVEEEEKAKAAERDAKEQQAAVRRREAKEKLWAEAAEAEERAEAEREARGEAQDGSVLELLYEKQRMMERQRKAKGGASSAVVGRADDAFLPGAGENNSQKPQDGSTQLFHDPKFGLNDDDEDDNNAAGGAKYTCNACKKSFLAPKQWTEHIQSSKHKTKVKQLQQKGIDVTTLLVVPPAGPSTDESAAAAAPATTTSASASSSTAATASKTAETQKTSNPKQQQQQQAASGSLSSSSEEENPSTAKPSEKKKKQGTTNQKKAQPSQNTAADDMISPPPSQSAKGDRKKETKEETTSKKPPTPVTTTAPKPALKKKGPARRRQSSSEEEESGSSSSESDAPTFVAKSGGAFAALKKKR